VCLITCSRLAVHIAGKRGVVLLLVIQFFIWVSGCAERVSVSSQEQLAEFERLGSVCPEIDTGNFIMAQAQRGPYRVVIGDVLELNMPRVLQVLTLDGLQRPAEIIPYACRVSADGTITLPLVGELRVVGKTLDEIERTVINAYYPTYAVTRPSIVAKVAEHRKSKVSVVGAVENPGVYELRGDQMSVVALLMEAGGIEDEGAAAIRILRSQGDIQNEPGMRSPPKGRFIAAEQLSIARSNSRQMHVCGSDGTGIRLTYRQTSPPSTFGWFIVEQNQEVLVVGRLDITIATHRTAVLEKLTTKFPHVPIGEVREGLCALAETLKPGCVNGNGWWADTSEEVGLNMIGRDAVREVKVGTAKYVHSAVGKTWGAYSDFLAGSATLSRESETFVLPIKGLNTPFADVALQQGDTVVVERLGQPMFTVFGLVEKPGNFPYPPDVQYNLMQAIAFAGGLDRDVEPRYASIYRLKRNGQSAHVTLAVTDGTKLVESSNVIIRPGDIIVVEQTPKTRTKQFLDKTFRANIGIYAPLYMLGG
jgi:protein involved in polysaccharide export with SLBB domain